MKVFVRPLGLHSRAMIRVADALTAHAPRGVHIVRSPAEADLVVSHVIGPDAPPEKPEVVIQYCYRGAGLSQEQWLSRWRNAKLTWSYYDLPELTGQNDFSFYHAPLGVDPAFTTEGAEGPREGVLTSGYVSSPIGEAIEEVALAAWMFQIPVYHLGPESVSGMRVQVPMRSILGVTDAQLAGYYRRVKWVSGLRQVEGFELPVIEGLCCGARPIVFDRPDMQQWYLGHAVFIPECSGEELIKHLIELFGSEEPEPVLEDERQWARERFNWAVIAKGFWERAL